jgi:tricorn protease
MRYGTCIAALAMLYSFVAAGAEEGRFMRTPDIHGSTIVFTYEGDLWSVPASGGTAVRLTSHPGVEDAAKISPDGATIAFTASYDGNDVVYIMPISGGSPIRLTYMPGGAQSICWTPDGKRVVFQSSFETVIYRDPQLFTVDTDGSLPERLPTGVFAAATLRMESPSCTPARKRRILLETLQRRPVSGYLAL